MPRNNVMTWNRKQKRWFKKSAGKQYVVSCRVLSKDFPDLYQSDTEEGSYRAANAWWRERDIEGKTSVVEKLTETFWDTIRRLDGEIKRKQYDRGKTVVGMEQINRRLRDGEITPTAALSLLQRIAHPTEEGQSLSECAEKFLSVKRSEVGDGIGEGRFNVIQQGTRMFLDFCGPVAIDSINGATLVDYRSRLGERVATKEIKPATAKNLMQVAKQLIRFCYETERLSSLPRNIDSKSLTVTVEPREVEIFETEEIKSLLLRATERTKLYVLLMLNCGMSQKDISDLRHSEVNWEAGTITRRRSKTCKQKTCPVVTYPLWSDTLRLLKEYRDDTSDRVLLTRDGTPLVRRELVGDHFKISDAVRTAWTRIKPAPRLPCKHLRKTSSSLLASQRGYASVASLFLGHSPKGMAERHYTKAPLDLLAEAVEWLGAQFKVS